MEQIIHSTYTDGDYLYRYMTYNGFTGTVSLHRHEICELLFLKEGNLTYTVEGQSYPLGPNCLVISRPMEAHFLTANGPTRYERYNLLLNPQHFSSRVYEAIPDHIRVIHFGSDTRVSNLFQSMDYYCNRGNQEMLRPILLHLAEEVLYNVLLSQQEAVQSDIDTANPVLVQAIRYIEKNLMTPLRLETICEALYITKSHLHHLFAAHLHTTPRKYIMDLKLRMVQRELQSGRSPTDICTLYGFGSYAAFFRNYKQRYGVSPSQVEAAEVVRDIL